MDTISETSYEIYKNKIFVFYDFLLYEQGINDKSYQSYLEAMKIEEIQESLDYYIKSKEIKSESVAWHYISVVKRYFKFIYKLGIQNVNLIKSFSLSDDNIDSFQNIMRKKIFNDNRLKKKESISEIEWEDANILISECDQQLKELIDVDRILIYKVKPTKYNDLLLTIIIKVILFTGVSYQVIRDIKFKKENMIHNTISINGYSVHLPNKLSEQMTYYLNKRNKVLEDNEIKSELLFVNADGTKLRKQTSSVADQLNEYLGRGDVTGIRKFAIIKMIERGINQSVLQDFTGVGKKIYSYCQNKVNESKNISASRYLDAKIRSLEIFDML